MNKMTDLPLFFHDNKFSSIPNSEYVFTAATCTRPYLLERTISTKLFLKYRTHESLLKKHNLTKDYVESHLVPALSEGLNIFEEKFPLLGEEAEIAILRTQVRRNLLKF